MSQCTEQDVLTLWPIVGHYRYPATRHLLVPAGRASRHY